MRAATVPRHIGIVERIEGQERFCYIRVAASGRREYLHVLDCPGRTLPPDMARVSFEFSPFGGKIRRLTVESQSCGARSA